MMHRTRTRENRGNREKAQSITQGRSKILSAAGQAVILFHSNNCEKESLPQRQRDRSKICSRMHSMH